LELQETTPINVDALSHISGLAQLTALRMTSISVAISNHTMPSLGALTGLQALSLRGCNAYASIHPEVLVGMTGLTGLALCRCFLLNGGAGMAELLQLPALRQMRKLHLEKALMHLLPQASAPQFSALTSSTLLSSLSLMGYMVPVGVWAALFGGQQLPQLRHLTLKHARAHAGGAPPLTSDDLQRLASSCPGLHDLCMVSTLQQGADLAPLRQLPHLTSLRLSNVSTWSVSHTLARLSQLQELIISPPHELDNAFVFECLAWGLQQVTHVCVRQGRSRRDGGCRCQRVPAKSARWCLVNRVLKRSAPLSWRSG
jgi:hypothetical protein